jgi:hypothetical protein
MLQVERIATNLLIVAGHKALEGSAVTDNFTRQVFIYLSLNPAKKLLMVLKLHSAFHLLLTHLCFFALISSVNDIKSRFLGAESHAYWYRNISVECRILGAH